VEKPPQEEISKEREDSSVTNANQCGNRSSEKSDATFGNITISDDYRNCLDTAFLVFCKAFNQAAHTIKNQLYKIHETINVQSNNWLSERSQSVITNENTHNHECQIHVQQKYLDSGPANLFLIHIA